MFKNEYVFNIDIQFVEWNDIMAQLRIDKYISQALNVSRQEAKSYIKSGQVTLEHGEVITDPNRKVDPDITNIYYKGEIISFQKFVYYMLNKPQSVVSATMDAEHKTVLDCIDDKIHKDLFPVGRLDIDTEGLLIITNDGPLGHKLTSPKHHVKKTYYVEVTGALSTNDCQVFQSGIDIGEKHMTQPAILEILTVSDTNSSANVTICEGKFHQIKRMFHAVGHEVTFLKRIQMGPLYLDQNLCPGEYRPLTETEIELLKR